MRAERIIKTLRDVGCIVVGLGVIAHQTVIVPPGQASEILLITAVTVLGIPAGAGLLSLRSGGSDAQSGASSSPSSDGRPPPSSSASPTPSGAGDPR